MSTLYYCTLERVHKIMSADAVQALCSSTYVKQWDI